MDFTMRKKRTPVIVESSSSADDEKPIGGEMSCDDQIQTHPSQVVTPRSSERIQKKRNRKVHIPSKKEVWEKITPAKSPGKYDHLRPRKLVNNFTKENNRYNYDPNETSGEESLDDFIVDDNKCVISSSDDSACGSDEEETSKKTKKPVRIRGRHHRLKVGNQIEESSSSDSDDEETVNEEINKDKDCENRCRRSLRLSSHMEHCETYSHGNNDLHNVGHERGDNNSCLIETVGSSKRTDMNDDDDVGNEDASDASSGNNGLKLRTGSKRNRSVIESENDSDDSDIRVGTRNKHNRSVIESDSEDGVEVMEYTNPEQNGNSTIDKVQPLGSVNSNVINENTDDSGIVGEPELKSVGCNSFGSNGIGTQPSASRIGSSNEEKAHKICDVTNLVEESGSIMNSTNDSDSSDMTEGDSDDSGSECDNDSSDQDDDLDEDIENSRIRVRKLRKKKEKDRLFDRFRMERQRKLTKSK